MPIVAVFTKFDQFKLNIQMELEDSYANNNVSCESIRTEVEKTFKQDYLDKIDGNPGYVQLQSKLYPSFFTVMS